MATDADTTDPAESVERQFCDVCGSYYETEEEARRHIVRSHTFDERIAANITPGEAPTTE